MDKMEKIVSLCKRRGFIFPSSEIYGGIGSVWDYGPLGVLLKNNVKAAWWKKIVQEREDVVGLDAAILMHPKVWEASGHVKEFFDLMVDCKNCKKRFRLDELRKNTLKKHKNTSKCPECGGELTKPRPFNLMFKTFMGPVEDEASIVYLRPETAQGIFVNFKNILNSSRLKIPFGIAQIGKSFRNEITPGNFTFRTREFEQMELEYFVPSPKIHESGIPRSRRQMTPEDWFKYWVEERYKWYIDLGIKKENLRIRQHKKEELSHYSQATSDIEYNFPFGWSELEGIANRGDYDLKQHQEYSGKDLTYFDEETKKKYLPHIIEPSGGVDRAVLAFLVDSYEEIKNQKSKIKNQNNHERSEGEIVLHLHPALAPIKCAVLPLVKKGGLPEKAKEIYQDLQKRWFVDYDEVASIGRRYRRQDEIGTPYCITVDFQTLEDNTVTVRDRETLKQDRVSITEIKNYLEEKLKY